MNQSSIQPASQPAPQPLHPEIRSVVQLTLAHAHKIYFSGPLVRRYERQPDGQRPAKDEGWKDVWAQLGGNTLSIWDMKEIEEASKAGKEVPPSYVNTTDAVSSYGARNAVHFLTSQYSLCNCWDLSLRQQRQARLLFDIQMFLLSIPLDQIYCSSPAHQQQRSCHGRRHCVCRHGRNRASKRYTRLI
jgi:hypothetical protein